MKLRFYTEERLLPSSPQPAEKCDLRLIDINPRNVKKLRLLLHPELFHSPGPVRMRLNEKDQTAIDLKRDWQLLLRSNETYTDPYLAYADEVVLAVPK